MCFGNPADQDRQKAEEAARQQAQRDAAAAKQAADNLRSLDESIRNNEDRMNQNS